MNILVTGATGFLGKFLCKTLIAKENKVWQVNTQNADLLDERNLYQFNEIKFERIYHLAAWTQAGDFCLKHPGEQWLLNQKINTHVLSWWQKWQPQAKIICVGTSCAYDPNYPLEEDFYLQGQPIESLQSYGSTKRMLLNGLIAFNKQFNLDYLYLIPSTLYGPHYAHKNKQLHFIFDLIQKIIQGHLVDKPVVLWGDGEQKRELIHVEDFVDTLLQLVEVEKNSVINIGAGKEYSIKEFAHVICDHIGFPFSKIEFDLNRYVGARSKMLSIEKLQRILPDYEPRSLEIGLHETIDWFKEKIESSLATT